MIQNFKSHLLSFIEYRTAAISHGCPSLLEPLDDILTRLLVRLNIIHEEAISHFNLAPFCTRRDIAQLGLIHRAVLRKGLSHLHTFFTRVRCFAGHSDQIYDLIAGVANCLYVAPCSV